MIAVGEDQTKSHLALIHHFVQRCLAVNRNGNDHLDGIAIVGMIVAMFENMHGRLDSDVPQLLSFVLDELQHQATLSDPSKQFGSMLRQAIAMALAYDARLVF